MNYIVLDLEWNQCPAGKDREVAHLPFEIIEIGAVRLDENHVPSGRFHEIVRPQVYTSLHFRTKEIVTVRDDDLQKARSFPEVASDFFAWCGENPHFCTWGPADLTELQRNLAFHGIPSPFPFPLIYYDIQKIFSIIYEDRRTRRSLEYAVDYLKLPKEVSFHSALSDAWYTSLVMQRIGDRDILNNSSVDYYRTPDNRRQEIRLRYSTYTKLVSKPFESRNQAMKDRVITSTICYECGRPAPKKMRWFPLGSRNYCCLACCPEHGYLKGKIRLRKREDGKTYAIKTLRLVSDGEAAQIIEKKELQRIRQKHHKSPEASG